MSSATSPITVESIWIFPLKSAKGIQLQSSGYSETGFNYDRQWMIVDAQTHVFLTARNIGKMILIEPALDLEKGLLHITVPAHNDKPSSTHSVSLSPPDTPSPDTVHNDLHIWGTQNEGYEVGTPELVAALSSFMGKDVLLVMKGSEPRTAGPEVGWIDSIPDGHVKTSYEEPSSLKWNDQFPILLVSLASYAAVNSLIWKDEQVRKINNFDEERWNETRPGLEVERFRANLVVDGVETAWEEDGWGTLEFTGKAGEKETMFVAARCARCMLPNVSPSTGVRDKVVPHSVLSPWRNVWSLEAGKVCFGANIVPEKNRGTIRVGDAIRVVKSYPLVDGLYIRPEDADA